MKLTGKCKEEFLDQSKFNEVIFNNIGEVHQNALIIEFFDSVGIYIEIYFNWQYTKVGYRIKHYDMGCCNSRTEATNEAIIKANEIFNLNNK